VVDCGTREYWHCGIGPIVKQLTKEIWRTQSSLTSTGATIASASSSEFIEISKCGGLWNQRILTLWYWANCEATYQSVSKYIKSKMTRIRLDNMIMKKELCYESKSEKGDIWYRQDMKIRRRRICIRTVEMLA